MENNLITTIIPTYRRPKLLKRAIESALNQTLDRIVVHVYDDASNDETEEVVRECMKKDPRVHYLRHPENIGLLRNYQFGLSQVKTPYFSFLSDDDVMFPWFYEETMKGFEQFPEAALSAGSAIIMSEKGKVIRVPMDLWEREGVFSPPEGLLQMISKYPVPSCALFHRKVIDAVAIDMTNGLTWDCDYFLQIAARYPIYISKRPCGIFFASLLLLQLQGIRALGRFLEKSGPEGESGPPSRCNDKRKSGCADPFRLGKHAQALDSPLPFSSAISGSPCTGAQGWKKPASYPDHTPLCPASFFSLFLALCPRAKEKVIPSL